MLGAYYGARRRDQFIDDHTTKVDEEKENQKLTNAIQTLGLGSVLIATATFAAAFTMPGGYRADDHAKSGLPTLAEKYAFKAFLVSDIVAFLCSFHSTMILLFRGVSSSKPHLKKQFVSVSLRFIILASRCTLLSFALAIFVLIAPANNLLGILILIIGGFVFQYDGFGRDYSFINDTISRRAYWWQLLQNKLPESTLRRRPPAWMRYVASYMVRYFDLVIPIVVPVVVPLIMVHG